MATAKITLIGLHNYSDGAIWDDFALPDYYDKDTAVNTILLQGGEFESLYANPDSLKGFIKIWCLKNERFFERLADLMAKEYEPLENYDRHESWHDEGTSSSTGESAGEDEGKVSAYNSSDYENRDKSITSSNSSGSGEYETDRTGRAHGNIGVMSSQDMFKQELDVIEIGPYDIVARAFINDFCIKVYV